MSSSRNDLSESGDEIRRLHLAISKSPSAFSGDAMRKPPSLVFRVLIPIGNQFLGTVRYEKDPSGVAYRFARFAQADIVSSTRSGMSPYIESAVSNDTYDGLYNAFAITRKSRSRPLILGERQ
jgi:hypothetical protein